MLKNKAGRKPALSPEEQDELLTMLAQRPPVPLRKIARHFDLVNPDGSRTERISYSAVPKIAARRREEIKASKHGGT